MLKTTINKLFGWYQPPALIEKLYYLAMKSPLVFKNKPNPMIFQKIKVSESLFNFLLTSAKDF